MIISYPGAPIVESLPSKDRTVQYYLKECPRCKGTMVQDRELIQYALEQAVKCLNCGFRVNKWR